MKPTKTALVAIFILAFSTLPAQAQYYGSSGGSGGGYSGLVAAPKNTQSQPSYYPQEKKPAGPVDFSNLSGQQKAPSAAQGTGGALIPQGTPGVNAPTPLELRDQRVAEIKEKAAALQAHIELQQQQQYELLNARIEEHQKKMLEDQENSTAVPPPESAPQ